MKHGHQSPAGVGHDKYLLILRSSETIWNKYWSHEREHDIPVKQETEDEELKLAGGKQKQGHHFFWGNAAFTSSYTT